MYIFKVRIGYSELMKAIIIVTKASISEIVIEFIRIEFNILIHI